jgi:histidine phosphotransferase ChpT
MQIDMRVLELLSSKICHDLVSPVSAINNGVELIEDIGGSVVDEAMKLIGNSAGHASRRLRLFRMAYGRAGNEDNLSVREVRQTAEQYLSTGKTMLSWPEDQPVADIAVRHGFLKTLLNMMILSEELLAYGGVVTLRDVSVPNQLGCRLEIVGRGAQLAPQYMAALEGTAAIDDLSPRTIQAYMTGRFAEGFELEIAHEQPVPDRLDLVLTERAVSAAVHTSMPE